MSDKVQFQTNIPVEVALKYGDGKEVNGQYGDQVLYTLTDGRVMYVPPIVKRRIEELGIGRGELFTLTKAEKKNGTRRTIEWVVAPRERGDRQPQERVQPPNGQRPAHQPNGTVVPRNANGHRANSTNDTKGFLVTSHGQLLLQSMAAAVDVAGATERYAAASGVELQFTSEDLREIGLRIYANGQK
ncbi:MAG TPA: hypothetical protein VMQ17_08020 [Candidatus Sulfotelmatobacter sp.]|nr:hypothetical protein [Candidatus Sulfotelmatobacter sp.]